MRIVKWFVYESRLVKFDSCVDIFYVFFMLLEIRVCFCFVNVECYIVDFLFCLVFFVYWEFEWCFV